jgi:iron complex outermembrane receptor protein
MKFQRTRVAAALTCVLGLGGALLVAGSAQAADIKVDVTGTNIKRIDAEGPAPVTVITKEDIAKTGATTLNELLNYIPTIDIYNQGEIASNSPSGSGTATIRMRGLAETNTLVLLNGRRLPVNALYDSSGAGAAVDINMFPASAIERVEILKDGGSAIYGADAVAGVVNFITRKDYQGVEATARYGISSKSDGQEWGGSLAAGFGSYDKDGYNVLFALDLFKRDPIYRKDREITKSVDFRRYGSGDGRSSYAPQGNFLDPDTGAFVGRSVQPCAPADFNGGRCRYDFNASLLTAYNGADRWGGMVVGNLKITNDLKATAQLSYAEAKDHFEAHPVPAVFLYPGDTGVIAGRFMQGGPRITDRKSTLFDANVGLEGTTKWFDWDVAVGHGEQKVSNRDKNYYDSEKWDVATSTGLIDPTVFTNDPKFVESLKVSPVREGKSKLDFADLRLRGDAFNLPAGTLGWAVGGSWWKESLSDQPDKLTQEGNVVGSIQQSAVDASRDASAVFGELSIPVLKSLEVQAAVRYDKYEGGKSATSPKAAVLWTPIKELALRASYTESFRMPSLKQLYGAREEGAATIFEDQDCVALGFAPGCVVSAYQVNGSNPDLKPEKGKTYNFGFVTDVGPFSATVDWWRIDKKDAINTPTLSSAIEQGLYYRDNKGQLFILTNLQNSAEAKNEGIDWDLRLRFANTPIGTWTLRDAGTYYVKQRLRETGGEWVEYNGTYALPRWKHVVILSNEYGPWAWNLLGRVTAGFVDTENGWAASSPIPSTIRQVAPHDEWDITGVYTGFKNWSINGGVKNIFNRTPPYSVTNALNNTKEQVGFAPLYSSRGTFFFASVTYSYK